MGASSVPFVIFTLFWLLVGGVAPWFVPKGVNRGPNIEYNRRLKIHTVLDCAIHAECGILQILGRIKEIAPYLLPDKSTIKTHGSNVNDD